MSLDDFIHPCSDDYIGHVVRFNDLLKIYNFNDILTTSTIFSIIIINTIPMHKWNNAKE